MPSSEEQRRRDAMYPPRPRSPEEQAQQAQLRKDLDGRPGPYLVMLEKGDSMSDHPLRHPDAFLTTGDPNMTGEKPIRKRVRGPSKASLQTIDLTPHLAPVERVLALTGKKAAPGWLDALRAALAPAIAQAVAAYAASLLAGHKQEIAAQEAELADAAQARATQAPAVGVEGK